MSYITLEYLTYHEFVKELTPIPDNPRGYKFRNYSSINVMRTPLGEGELTIRCPCTDLILGYIDTDHVVLIMPNGSRPLKPIQRSTLLQYILEQHKPIVNQFDHETIAKIVDYNNEPKTP